MRYFVFIIVFLVIPVNVDAGGDSFDIKVVSLEKISGEEYHLSFIPLNAPYGMELEDFTDGHEQMTVVIKFGCNQNFLTCMFTQRTFSKTQHEDAITKLIQQAVPGEKMKFGVMSEGFRPLPLKTGYYRSNGLFIADDVVYSYYNSHL